MSKVGDQNKNRINKALKDPAASCLTCARCYLDPDNKRFAWCADLERWQPRDYLCGLYVQADRTLDQVFGKPELGLQIEAGQHHMG